MPVPWPTQFDSPVLESLRPVVENPRHVHTSLEKIKQHAGWMAYEELPFPQFFLPFGIGDDRDRTIDFTLVSTCLNFAFTDFGSHQVFYVDFEGRRWWDAEGMFACLKRAHDEGVPVLDGRWLRSVRREELEKIFRSPTAMPLLDERTEILRHVGATLTERYDGYFHNFVEAHPPRLYAGDLPDRQAGKGILQRLVAEFPRFNDVSRMEGHEVKFYKLAQLGLWMLHCTPSGGFRLEDIERMTAFADYIVPMALRFMEILTYSPELEAKIQRWQPIARDSREEIEIRAHSLYATALFTEEINRRRPADRQIIIPQLDARLWTHYHASFTPHHLTRTIMY